MFGQNSGGSTRKDADAASAHAANAQAETDADTFSDEERMILLKMQRLIAIRSKFRDFVKTSKKLNWAMIRREVGIVKAEINIIKKAISPEKLPFRNQHTKSGMKICKDGVQLCNDLRQSGKQLAGQSDAQKEALLKRVLTLVDKITSIESSIRNAEISQPIRSPGPNLTRAQQNQSQGATKSDIENSRFRVSIYSPHEKKTLRPETDFL